MVTLDYIVLVVYFVGMAMIGWVCSHRIRHQEDFFLGGRSFGKVLQAFAAFGAGTGAYDPVALGRTTYTSGLSGIWSVLLWLFVTPFYWIFGVWYRRMRVLTLGDWFAERYQAKSLGAAYAVFAVCFNMWYLAVSFSAVGKICPPLMGFEAFQIPWLSDRPIPVEFFLIPLIAAVVVLYGVLGGLRAAYWTDLIQGVFIILLSILLIPFGLAQLVRRFGDPGMMSTLDGFSVMHEQVPAQYFEIIESPVGGEFPLHYIVAIVLLNLVGIVVQPHFIATGGGSAKTETSARVGLVVGNFMKRFCTVGWALTGLIVLALLADNVDIASDPDRVWGVAAVEILGPIQLGLVGLMLACLLAALMSSADCYMLVSSGVVVRNVYVAYLRPGATERECLRMGRIVSLVVIAGGVLFSLANLDVFDQLKIAWELPIIFAAPFWIGMFWRRATRRAAWITVATTAFVFFIAPLLLPAVWPRLREMPRFLGTNVVQTTVIRRASAPADIRKRNAAVQAWDATESEGPRPQPLVEGEEIEDVYTTGGEPLYWSQGIDEVGAGSIRRLREISREVDGQRTVVRKVYEGAGWGVGYFKLDFLLYDLIGFDLENMSTPALETLRLPPRVVFPFVLMFVLSFLTPRNRKEELDRFYVKMKTPTQPDPELDRREVELSYAQPDRFDHRKLFPGSQWEFQRPSAVDIVGFLLSVLGTIFIIWLAVWVAQIGA